jgi:hypothetical protein
MNPETGCANAAGFTLDPAGQQSLLGFFVACAAHSFSNQKTAVNPCLPHAS